MSLRGKSADMSPSEHSKQPVTPSGSTPEPEKLNAMAAAMATELFGRRKERPMWFISGCPVCGYSEHSPRPKERCPNDGQKLIRLEGRVGAWRRLEIAHRTVRGAIKTAREAAQEVPW